MAVVVVVMVRNWAGCDQRVCLNRQIDRIPILFTACGSILIS